MALPYAILIALHEDSGSGYEIAQRFDQGMGYFWESSHQQIYQTLAKMADKSWVEFEEITQEGKPDKKVYRATQQGINELKNWLEQPTKLQALKDPLLMKLYAGPLTSPEILLNEIQSLQQKNQILCATYKDIEKQWFQNINQQPIQYQYIYLTLRNGIISIEAWLNWSKEVISFLQKQL